MGSAWKDTNCRRILESTPVPRRGCTLVMASCYLIMLRTPEKSLESRMDCWNIRSEKGREDQSHISLEFGTVLEPISGGLSRS